MIDSRAIVSDEARIDPSVKIGPYSIIEGEVEIGAGTIIGPHVVIKGPCRIGRDNEIYQFAVVGEVPQDLKFAGEHSLLEIGDRNRIREYASLHRGTEGGGGITRVGNDNLFMAYTHIAHDCSIGDHVILANAASLAGHVRVEDHAILGGFAVVHQFCRIGAHAFIGGASKITQDVAPYVMVDGAKARSISINKEGLKRRGFSAEEINQLAKAFKRVIKSRMVAEEAWAELDAAGERYPAVKHLLDFLRSSKRGVIR